MIYDDENNMDEDGEFECSPILECFFCGREIDPFDDVQFRTPSGDPICRECIESQLAGGD